MLNRIAPAIVSAVFIAFGAAAPAAEPTSADLSAVDASIDKALAWLASQRDDRGAWRSEYGPGITGLVVTAFLNSPGGQYRADSPEVAPALNYLAGLQRPDGSIFDPESQIPLPNYNTSTALMALAAADNPKYAETIRKAQEFLIDSQTDEGEGATPEDSNYGGIGYGSDPAVRDLSNLNIALQALKASGASEESDVWDNAIVFLSRLQNNSETNDQDWSGDDGGLVYSPGVSKAGEDILGRPRSYASMTYAGLLSFIYANVDKDDPRVQAAYDWIREHWNLDENFPMGQQGLYYGYHTIGKALAAYGETHLRTTAGETVDWYAELSERLLEMQSGDGSWPPNEADRWLEGDPVLVTAYALLALEAGYPTGEDDGGDAGGNAAGKQ